MDSYGFLWIPIDSFGFLFDFQFQSFKYQYWKVKLVQAGFNL